MAASAPSGIGAWSTIINILRVDFLRGSWGTLSVKGFIAGGGVSQRNSRLARLLDAVGIAIVFGDGLRDRRGRW